MGGEILIVGKEELLMRGGLSEERFGRQLEIISF